MSLSINRVSIPQNNSRQVAFGELGDDGLENRVAKLEKQAIVQNDFNKLMIEADKEARIGLVPESRKRASEIAKQIDTLA